VATNGVFSENRKAWFDRTMVLKDLERVHSFATDVTKFDFSTLGPIAFCLSGADLYQPIRDDLPKIFAALSPGGIIVVDDCQPDAPWDGATLRKRCGGFYHSRMLHLHYLIDPAR
jgi:O-methyltransferase